jgi:hypothetical protein
MSDVGASSSAGSSAGSSSSASASAGSGSASPSSDASSTSSNAAGVGSSSASGGPAQAGASTAADSLANANTPSQTLANTSTPSESLAGAITPSQSLAAASTPSDALANANTPIDSLRNEPTAAEQLAGTAAAASAPPATQAPAADVAAPTSWTDALAQQLGVPPEQVQPAFYQEPGFYVSTVQGVPREGTHVGMTEDAARAAGFSESFAQAAAAHNANIDATHYDNDAAHAYNFSGDATLARAADLGEQVKSATDALVNAKTDAVQRAATDRLARAFGAYEHMVQDNWAHGGTDRAQHYGAGVDRNPDSIAAGQREASTTFAEFGSYLQSRGIDPATLDAGPRPAVSGPPTGAAIADQFGAPDWDGVDRMWDRPDMANQIREQFNGQLR